MVTLSQAPVKQATTAHPFTARMAARLTLPLLDGWHIVFPLDVHRSTCQQCDTRAVFVRVQADDCDAWGLRGIDGAHSDAYGIYCQDHA